MTRSRLLMQLADASRFALTFISAPAGYGKTTLLSQWVSTREDKTPWVSLDDADNSISQAVTTVVKAIQQVEPFAGNQTLSLLTTSQTESPLYLASILVDEMATVAKPVTIILDDFHVLDDGEVLLFLESLFRMLPPNLHLIISSRHAPPFATSLFRGYGQLMEIDMCGIAFSDDEAAEFLRSVAGRPLAKEDVSRLVATAAGWPAALQVIALTLRRLPNPDDLPRVVDSSASDFRAFLHAEVLDRLPGDLQQTLVRLAVADRISPALAATLLGEGASPPLGTDLLRSIADHGLFLVPLGLDGAWYQFHSLFRDALLERQAAMLEPEEIANLHALASCWFEAHRDIDSAVSHAVRSRLPGRAAGIVAANAQKAIAADRWIEVEHWIDMLDDESRTTNPEIMVAEAYNLHARARYGRLVETMRHIRERLDAGDETIPEDKRRLYEADLVPIAMWVSAEVGAIDRQIPRLRAAYPILNGTARFSELFLILVLAGYMGMRDPDSTRTLLLEILSSTGEKRDDFSRLKAGWTRCALAHTEWHAGNLTGIEEHARQSLAIARTHDACRLAAQNHVFIGLALYERNDLTGAEHHLRSAVDNPRCGAIFLTVAVSRLVMCLNAMRRKDDCDRVIDQFTERLLETNQMDNAFTFRATVARIAYSRGQFSNALSLIEEIRLTPAQADSRAMEVPWLFKAILLYQRGGVEDIQEADTLMAAVEEGLAGYSIFRHRLTILCAHAFRAHRRGDNARARILFRDALRRAERKGFVRTLLDLGEAGRYLLRRFGDESSYARMLLAHLTEEGERSITRLNATTAPRQGGRTVPNPAPLIEPLTNREIDVLEGLQQRLSSKEIASHLSVSPLTVKTHLRNLYAKLGVSSRRQAIARAMEIGILE